MTQRSPLARSRKGRRRDNRTPANCAVFAQLMSGIGWVVAGPSTEGFLTEFDVHVFNTAGNPADAEFSLYAIC